MSAPKPSAAGMQFAIKWGQAIVGNDPFGVQLLAHAYDKEFSALLDKVAELQAALEAASN